uniref:MATH domain-containing protein n=1 Tax=Clastoptera arizonana TaxID=38151 RepID=A0A1B6CX55_9HEMI
MEVYEKENEAITQCYFCGEELSPSQLELHVKHCGLVLEPCPDNCGLYVQRQYKSHHSTWCKKDPLQVNQSIKNEIQNLRSEINTIRTSLEIDINIRHQQQADWAYQVTKFNQRFQRADELNNKVINALTSFKKLISEEREARIKDFHEVKNNIEDVCNLAAQLKFTVTQAQIDISEMKSNYNLPEKDNKFFEEFAAWKSRQEMIIASLKIKVDKELNEEIYKLHKANITRSKSVSDLLDLNELIIDEQDKYSEQFNIWQKDIEKFKLFLNEENIMISGVWRDQLEEIKKLKCNIEDFSATIDKINDEQCILKEKINNLQPYQESRNVQGKEKLEEVVGDLLDKGVTFRKKIEDLEKMVKSILNKEGHNMETNELFKKDQDSIKMRLMDVENILKGYSETLKLPKECNEKKVNKIESQVMHHYREDFNPKNDRLKSPTQKYRLSEEFVEKKQKSNNSFVNLENLKPSSSLSAFENGRVKWTITNFAQNMKLAKETNDEIEGPIFYSHEFGYKFQLKTCLNGIGQWRGRHMIVALHIMQSEWDALLKWPCRINVVICLVDQVAVSRKAKDIVKSFTSSSITRHSDYKCLQMFIPHRTLAEHSYIKEDTVILKVKLKVISI